MSLIIITKWGYGSCRQLFPHMEKFRCAFSEHLFVQSRTQALYCKGFKKLAISLILTVTQNVKVRIVEIFFSTYCRFSQVILDLWFTRWVQVQMFIVTSLIKVSCCVADVVIGAWSIHAVEMVDNIRHQIRRSGTLKAKIRFYFKGTVDYFNFNIKPWRNNRGEFFANISEQRP